MWFAVVGVLPSKHHVVSQKGCYWKREELLGEENKDTVLFPALAFLSLTSFALSRFHIRTHIAIKLMS